MNGNGWNGSRRGLLRDEIVGYWDELAALAAAMNPTLLGEAASLLLETQRRGRTVLFAGNGGSAATASHFACDLAKGTRDGGPPTFRAVALTDNVPLISAWANDSDYVRVFAEQVRGLAQPGDLLVAISASGNSPNMVAAAEAARDAAARVLALTGRDGGKLAPLADIALRVPADRIEIVEDAHMAIGHSLCVAARATLAAYRTDDAVVSTIPLLADPDRVEASA
jgi:D-sedoheptulose 7-phosphate isomerase